MNYQSIPRRFNAPTNTINISYIDASLRDKQNTIDSNFGLLDQSVEKVLGTDLARAEDREYLKGKVSDVLNTLQNTDSIRFDSKKAAFTIQGALSQAAKDPEILKQVANTRNVRQVQQFYQDRAKKGDLNQQNFQYAYKKSGIDSYMSGKSDDIGSFNYLEYVDVDAKLDEVARKLKAANPNEEVSLQNPLTGETVSKKVSMVTPEEMRGYLRVQLNANDLKQLEIDGSMMYGMDDSKALEVRDNIISQNGKVYADKVSLLENYRDNGNKTQGEKDEINGQITALGAEKSYFERGMIGQKTAEAIGGQQLIENKIGLYSQLYTKNGPESIEYDNDYLKRMRDANATANLNANGNGNISTITTPTDLADDIDPYADSLKRIDEELTSNSNYLKDSFSALDDNKKKLVNDTMKEIKNDPKILALYKGQPISNEALQLETINRLGANFFGADVAKELRSKIASTKSIQEGVEKTTSEFVKSKVLEENTFDQLFEEETKLTMVTPQGDVNIQQFLKDNGVRNLDTYRSFIKGDSKEAKQLRATVALQSMSLSNDITTDDFSLSKSTDPEVRERFQGKGLIGTTRSIDLNESEYRIMRQSAHDIAGEALEEAYKVDKIDGNYRLTLKNPNSKLAKVVSRTQELYTSGRIYRVENFLRIATPFNNSDTDRTIRNESSLRKMFSEDEYRRYASENMDNIDKTVAGSNSIRIRGVAKEGDPQDPTREEILQYVDNATFSRKLPIDVYKKPDGSLLVYQTVQNETALTDEEAKSKQKIRQGTIQANDVPKMRLFNEQIDMMQKKTSFKTLEDVSGKIDKMTFIGDDRQQVESLNRLYSNYENNEGENMFRLLSSDKTAREIVFNKDVTPYLNNQQGQEIKSQFEDFVTNTQNYTLDFTKGLDSPYQVIIKNKKGDNIGSIPLNNDIPVDTFEKAYMGTPQVFLAMYSKSRVNKYINSMIANGR